MQPVHAAHPTFTPVAMRACYPPAPLSATQQWCSRCSARLIQSSHGRVEQLHTKAAQVSEHEHVRLFSLRQPLNQHLHGTTVLLLFCCCCSVEDAPHFLPARTDHALRPCMDPCRLLLTLHAALLHRHLRSLELELRSASSAALWPAQQQAELELCCCCCCCPPSPLIKGLRVSSLFRASEVERAESRREAMEESLHRKFKAMSTIDSFERRRAFLCPPEPRWLSSSTTMNPSTGLGLHSGHALAQSSQAQCHTECISTSRSANNPHNKKRRTPAQAQGGEEMLVASMRRSPASLGTSTPQ